MYINKMTISETIKSLREDNDLTQNQIAEYLKIDQSYYSKYERGIRPFPVEIIIKLTNKYNVSADYILGLPDNLPYPKR